MPVAKKTRLPGERVPIGQAVKLTGLSLDTLRRHLSRGVLTNARPAPDRGHGKPAILLVDEIEVLNDRGEDACREFRRLKGRD